MNPWVGLLPDNPLGGADEGYTESRFTNTNRTVKRMPIKPPLTHAPVLDRLGSIAKDTPEIAVLWLYGSQAKGTATPNSDYDLAVAFAKPLADPFERRLRPELLAQAWQDALDLPAEKLSVIDIDLAPIPLAMAVVRTGRPLCVNDPLRLAREENRITSMWELDYQHHQQQYG
ncbi:nucleotidyltransferase domain-containing protein [Guyparkeria halophila]|uniref:Nucleotidyltransferase domain-containing protein n=1 Tax=Guyparkeria halophila TaxID=47960 RepID=A0ABZ0YZ93_9GAMM|nr:nucleotidyltransferase domain-containing protein [Guyparkeria halophila]WQH17363.1 nucleotidyltransferase domain-containing protein [Guyparkeria halophila]